MGPSTSAPLSALDMGWGPWTAEDRDAPHKTCRSPCAEGTGLTSKDPDRGAREEPGPGIKGSRGPVPAPTPLLLRGTETPLVSTWPQFPHMYAEGGALEGLMLRARPHLHGPRARSVPTAGAGQVSEVRNRPGEGESPREGPQLGRTMLGRHRLTVDLGGHLLTASKEVRPGQGRDGRTERQRPEFPGAPPAPAPPGAGDPLGQPSQPLAANNAWPCTPSLHPRASPTRLHTLRALWSAHTFGAPRAGGWL